MSARVKQTVADAFSLLEVFWQHRSVRDFLPRPIPEEHVELILRAAQRASTDASAQMYSFIRITDPALRDRMATLAGNQQHIRDCAEYFIVCLDVYRLRRLLEHRGSRFGMRARGALLFGILDAALAAENLAVAAEMLGYGVCFIGAVQAAADRIARELSLPEGVLPLCGLCVGVPAPQALEEPPRPRLPLSVVVHENRYRDYTDDDLEACYAAMAPISERGDWYPTLRRYFAEGGIMERREQVLARAWRQQGLEPSDIQEEADA